MIGVWGYANVDTGGQAMRARQIVSLLIANLFFCALLAQGQDSQSLAEAARQSRIQKQQKDTQAKDTVPSEADTQPAKEPRVITNDDIPENAGSTQSLENSPHGYRVSNAPSNTAARKTSADQWKSRIQAQKNSIASMQREIASLSGSIHFPENCLPRTCAQRNERQLEKQNRVEIMNHQLDEQRQRLEELQESARKEGYGNSVYDP
jgi:glucose/arabinose dehydrogenase